MNPYISGKVCLCNNKNPHLRIEPWTWIPPTLPLPRLSYQRGGGNSILLLAVYLLLLASIFWLLPPYTVSLCAKPELVQYERKSRLPGGINPETNIKSPYISLYRIKYSYTVSEYNGIPGIYISLKLQPKLWSHRSHLRHIIRAPPLIYHRIGGWSRLCISRPQFYLFVFQYIVKRLKRREVIAFNC